MYNNQNGYDINGSLIANCSLKSHKYSSTRSNSRRFTWTKRTCSGEGISNGTVVMPLSSKRRTFRTSRSGTIRSAFNSSISSNNSTKIMNVMNDDQDHGRISHRLMAFQSDQQNQQNNLLPIRKPSFYDSSSLRRSTPVSSRNSYAKNSFLGI